MSAFVQGADFIVTGTMNQMSKEAGTCDYVRKCLREASYSDVTSGMSPDMMEQNIRIQCLKKGTFYAQRSIKLYNLYKQYNSLDEIPEKDIKNIEKTIFQKSIQEVWEETKNYFINILNQSEKIENAEKDPKQKLSLVFRWYMSKSSGFANRGQEEYKSSYQIWCGECIGTVNNFIEGTYLDPLITNGYPSVADMNYELFKGVLYLQRLEYMKYNPYLKVDIDKLRPYKINQTQEQKTFDMIDKNGDGYIDRAEFKEHYSKMNKQ